MFKLLVNLKTNEQVIYNIKPSGGYFDKSAVIWDERTDGNLPTINMGGMVRDGAKLVFSQARKDLHDVVMLAKQSEQTRIDDLDTEINNDTVLSNLKSMTNAEFNAYWSANVTTAAQANQVLKRLARLVIRKL